MRALVSARCPKSAAGACAVSFSAGCACESWMPWPYRAEYEWLARNDGYPVLEFRVLPFAVKPLVIDFHVGDIGMLPASLRQPDAVDFVAGFANFLDRSA